MDITPEKIAAARAAGATDTQIAVSLSERTGFKLNEARKAGATDAQVIEHIISGQGAAPQAAPQPEVIPPQQPGGATATIEQIMPETGMGMPAAIAPMVRPTLETLGLVGGGLIGSGAGPAGAVAGAGLGYAAGKRGADMLLGEQQSLGRDIASIPQDVAMGAAMEAGGGVAAKILGKLVAKQAGKAAKRIALKEAGKEFDVPLTAAEAKGTKGLARIESGLEMTGTGAPPIGRFRAKQAEAIEKARGGMSGKYGTSESTEAIGQEVQGAIKGKSAKLYKQAERLYNKVDEVVPPSTSINTSGLQEQAAKISDDIARLGTASKRLQNKELKDIANDLASSDAMEYKTLTVIRTRLRQLIEKNDAGIGKGGVKFMSNSEAGNYKMLKSAIEKDIDTYAEAAGGDIKATMDVARQFYGKTASKYDDKIIKRLLDTHPEKVADIVFKPNNITAMRKLYDAGGRKGFETARAQWLEGIIQGGNPGKMLDKYKPNELNFIFRTNREGLNQVRKLANVIDAAKGAQRLGGNPSGTAQNLITPTIGAGTIGLLFYNPAAAASIVIAPNILSRMYVSPVGRSLLTKGLEMPLGSAQAAGLATKLGALVSKIELERGVDNAIPEVIN